MIGGGNTAVEEALFLTNFASEVVVVHRRTSSAPRKFFRTGFSPTRRFPSSGTPFSKPCSVPTIPKGVTGARSEEPQDRRDRGPSPPDGIFIAIGHKPATELFTGQLDLNAGGYIITKDRSTRTSIPGVFAAGDVTDEIYRQAVTAAGMGCMAALEAEKWLRAQCRVSCRRRMNNRINHDAHGLGSASGFFMLSPMRAASPMPAMSLACRNLP